MVNALPQYYRGRSTTSIVRNYSARNPEVKQALEYARDAGLDEAESQLYKAIKKSQPWAIMFYLRTQGKSRGYVERQEVAGVESMPVVINFNRVPRRESLDDPPLPTIG